MNRNGIISKGATALLLCFFFYGCSTTATTHITSHPPGARIIINNQYQGETPITVQVEKPPMSQGEVFTITYVIKAEKEGYRAQSKVYRGSPFEAATYLIPNRLHFELRPKEKKK
jgi:hypothetical protein